MEQGAQENMLAISGVTFLGLKPRADDLSVALLPKRWEGQEESHIRTTVVRTRGHPPHEEHDDCESDGNVDDFTHASGAVTLVTVRG